MSTSTSRPSSLELEAEALDNRLLALEDRIVRVEEKLGLSMADMDDWYEARRGGDS